MVTESLTSGRSRATNPFGNVFGPGRQLDETVGAGERGEVAGAVGRARARPTCGPSRRSRACTGMKNASGALTSTGASSAMRAFSGRAPAPMAANSAGTTYRARHTSVETGLPGSANTAGPDCDTPNHNGLPGPLRDVMEHERHAELLAAPSARDRACPWRRRRERISTS